MAHSHLRLYDASAHEVEESLPRIEGDTVLLKFGEILPLLLDAVRSKRTWLDDFENDEIRISNDLYDILMAYKHFRPSA